MKSPRFPLLALSGLLLISVSGPAAETPAARAERMAWFKEARFGLFIHWGVYSVLGGSYRGEPVPHIGEWIMHHASIPIDEYERYARMFNPVFFDADAWASLAAQAGMKYIVITSKHHDGFALWDSRVSSYDVMEASPFQRDILRELSAACARHGLRLCFYHSIMDWHHPDAQAAFYPSYNDTEASNPNFPRYVETFLKPQLKELLTGYGPIGILWFDGEWMKDYTSPMGREIDAYVRSFQPNIIINNRVDKGRQGMAGLNAEGSFAGDYGTPEQEIPATGLPGVDWESCMTMNDTWGWKAQDHHWKSSETLVRNLIDIVSKGGNFLLNVGPTPEGLIPQPSVERLHAIGAWMRVHGEAITGASASPVPAPSWGRFTRRGHTLYAHVFSWPANARLPLPSGLPFTPTRARLLTPSGPLPLTLSTAPGGTTVVALPPAAPDPIASVLALD